MHREHAVDAMPERQKGPYPAGVVHDVQLQGVRRPGQFGVAARQDPWQRGDTRQASVGEICKPGHGGVGIRVEQPQLERRIGPAEGVA